MGQAKRNRIALAEAQPETDPGAGKRAAEMAQLARYFRDRQPDLPAEGLSELLEVLMTLVPMPGQSVEFVAKDGRPVFRLTYSGMCRLALRDQALIAFEAHVVYDKDTLAADYGSGILTHAPTLGEPGAVLGCYVQAVTQTGMRPWEFYRGALLLETAGEADTGSAEECLRRAAVRRYVSSSPLALQALRWALDAEAQSWESGRIVLPWLPAAEEKESEKAETTA
jgi:hypothetical protein